MTAPSKRFPLINVNVSMSPLYILLYLSRAPFDNYDTLTLQEQIVAIKIFFLFDLEYKERKR